MSRTKERVNAIEQVYVQDLVPFEKNPRKHDKSLPELMESIKAYGFTQPIVIDQKNRIVAGHGRRLACIELGITTVPCVRVDLTNDEYVKLMLADNKITELSKWDNKLLKDCLEILGDLSAIEVPGFSNDDIDKIFGHVHNETVISKDAEADFGEAGVKVESESDDRALVKRINFMLTQKEYAFVKDKLGAVKKEFGLDTEAEALIRVLQGVKGLTKVERKAGKAKEIAAE